MNKSFYGSLAVSNIKKNAKGYVPYMLTCTFSVMFFYIMLNLAKDSGVKEMIGGEILQSMLNFGSGVFGFFSAIFLFYTNSFWLNREKRNWRSTIYWEWQSAISGKCCFAKHC